MKLFISIALGLFFLFSISFAIFESLGYTEESYISDLFQTFQKSGWGIWAAGASGLALLAADLFLPVPSSVVMVLMGKLLGFTGAVAVNFTGGLASSIFGFYLTRRFGHNAFQKVVGKTDTERIERLFETYGTWVILLSRSVPMLTEIISCLAGLSDMSFRRFLLVSIVGLLPISVVYAWAGSFMQNGGGLELSVTVALIIPGLGFAALKLYQFLANKREAAEARQ